MSEKIVLSLVSSAESTREVVKKLRVLGENKVWLENRTKSLRKKYPDEYVAADQGKVVGHSKEIGELLGILRDRYEDFGHIAIGFISAKEIELILNST